MNHSHLKTQANKMRQLAVGAVFHAQSGHPGGALSICDMLSILFFQEMKGEGENRDRFVLSKGHASPAYYAALALKGHFPEEDLKTFRKIDSNLQGHPCMNKVPGVDMSTGSLGQGLSAANGMAMVGKFDKKDYRVYCICGDGESQEGQIWEAAMTAAHYKLDNLVLFLDGNGLQIDGPVEEVMNPGSYADKFRAFGWNVVEVDGHDFTQLDAGLTNAKETKGKPTVLVCKTIKGKGVSFMENQISWHGAAPKQDQYDQAIAELQKEEG